MKPVALIVVTGAILAACWSAAASSFEVVSVRPAAPSSSPAVAGAKGGGPAIALPACRMRIQVDGGLANFSCHSVRDLLMYAFGLLPDRIVGQNWDAFSQQFDVAAKLPANTTREQVPDMVLALLQDRFKLEYHREARNGPIYALTVAKGGVKLRPAVMPPEASAPDATLDMINGIRFRRTRVPSPDGKGSTVTMTSDAMGTVREAPATPDGVRHWEARSMSAQGLADLLTIATSGTPVVDFTGLQGRYQADLDISMVEFTELIRTGSSDRDELQNALFRAGLAGVAKLGLQLEPRKGPIESVVVDHIEKTPAEN